MKALALALGAIGAVAQAQPSRQGCTDAVEAALRAVGPRQTTLGAVVAQHCKAWPPSGGRAVAAVMAFQGDAKPGEDDAWEVVVALLDAQTHPRQMRWTHVGGDALTGINEYSFALDTAAYQLTPKLRALGLRFRSSANGSRYAEAYWGDELTLFVPEDDSLRAVLGVATQAQVHTGEKEEEWQVAKLVLAMGPPGPKGWADIVVTNTADGARGHWIYRYDGKAFGPLAKPAPFWARYCCALSW